MIRQLRVRAVAAVLALAYAMTWASPAVAAPPQISPDDAHAQQAALLLEHGCGAGTDPAADAAELAQVAPSATPSASGSPAPDASALPEASASPEASSAPSAEATVAPPRFPSGPQVLIPPVATPAGTITPPPLPTPTPIASKSPLPVPLTQQTTLPNGAPPTVAPAGIATAQPSAVPSAQATLGPDEYAILADEYVGANKNGAPQHAIGHVNILYRDGVIVGDRADYDGVRYIDVTGHAYVRNTSSDTVLTGTAIRFDTKTQLTTLVDGRGETSQGVERGKLYFRAATLVAQRNGVTHGEHGYLTTCDNPRGGYHIESKTLDIRPGDKAIARKATLYLGGLAVFYLPIVIISLAAQKVLGQRTGGFVPLLGYSQAEGYFMKARLGFAPSDAYYGYYRLEIYTKIGFGVGYVAFFRPRSGRRQVDVDFFRQKNKFQSSQNTNLRVADNENFSQKLRGQFGFSYQGNYGPLVSLPPNYDISAGLSRASTVDTTNISLRRNFTAGQYDNDNVAFTDQHRFTDRLQNQFSVNLQRSQSSFTGSTISTTQTHYSTLTSYTTPGIDYALTFDRYAQQNLTNLEKLPELVIRPKGPLVPKLSFVPITASLTLGQYNDHLAGVATERGEAQITIGPSIAHFYNSDFTSQVTLRQDEYGTGDLKGQIAQTFSLNTQLSGHIVNSLQYNEANIAGPQSVPFKQLDILGNNTKQATEVLKLYNQDVYLLTLSTGTSFIRQAQPIGYQLNYRPSRRSSVVLGGAYTPIPGFGFDRTNVQVATPFGRGTDIQFSTFVNWKAGRRLENKTIYLRKIIGDCYEIRTAYQQDTKNLTLSINLLAFPSRGVNFGLAQSGSIFPSNFSSDQFR